jgi:hypothetical protein
MQATVKVGDTYSIAGRTMTVVEVKTATDSGGTVVFDTAPATAVVRRLDDLPLAVAGDPYFACYLLRDTGGQGLYALGVFHPTLGERLQPATPAAAPLLEIFTMCWAPGPVRVLIDGQPAANETVSILLETTGVDGPSELLLPDKYKILHYSLQWQCLVDSGQRDSPYKTDALGFVYNAVFDEPLMFPRGDGAWGQRGGDLLHDGAETPEECVTSAWLCFRGRRVELVEGQPASLDWRTATLAINGPPGAWVWIELEDLWADPSQALLRILSGLDSGGHVTVPGLYPGRYCLSMYQPENGDPNYRDWSVISPRRWAELRAGETTTVALSFETPPSGHELAYVYTTGADSQAGIDVWGLTFHGHAIVGTTDGSGRVVLPNNPPAAELKVNDPHWGWQIVFGRGPTFEATLAGYDLLSMSMGYADEGGWWAFPGAIHDHLDAGVSPDWQVKVVQTGETIPMEPIPIGTRTTTPVPHLPPGTLVPGGWTFYPPPYTYDIVLLDRDGNTLRVLHHSQTAYRDGTDGGTMFLGAMGGKAWGDVLSHRPNHSTHPDLPEAARMGLEHGEVQPAAIMRLVHQGGATRESRLGWVCPYCLCMTNVWPGPGFGFCPQCGSDARSFTFGPPAAEGRWSVRYRELGPGGRRQDKLCGHWYRPLRYAELDAYLRMYEGLPRWVCDHPTLGEWSNGSWAPGADAASLEAEFCAPDEHLLVRPKLQIVGAIAGEATYRLHYRTDAGDLAYLDFDLAAGATGVKLLSPLEPVYAEDHDPADALFVRRVTSVELLEPDEDPGNHFLVVGDAPSLVLQGLPVRASAGTPLAVQIGPWRVAGGPDLRRAEDGRLFLAYVSEGDIFVSRRPSPLQPWSEPARVTEGGHFTDPSIAPLPTGVIVVAYTDIGDNAQHLAFSTDDGETWDEV